MVLQDTINVALTPPNHSNTRNICLSLFLAFIKFTRCKKTFVGFFTNETQSISKETKNLENFLKFTVAKEYDIDFVLGEWAKTKAKMNKAGKAES